MKTKIYLAIFILLIFGFGVFLYKRNSVNVALNNKPRVIASIFPIYDIVKNIAGQEVNVILVLPPGASPHTFDYTPSQIKESLGAGAMFTVGHNIDAWALSLAKAAEINNVIILDKNVKLIPLKYIDYGSPQNDNLDPHYWLSISNAEGIAKQIKDELSSLYPNEANIFESNYLSYLKKLDNTKTIINNELSARKGIKISVFHDAYEYFADEFGIDVVSSFEEFPGKQPTPQYIGEFEKKIKNGNVKVIFAEPQFSTTTIEPIATDLGVKLAILDPLGGVPGRDSYITLLQFNANQILENTK